MLFLKCFFGKYRQCPVIDNLTMAALSATDGEVVLAVVEEGAFVKKIMSPAAFFKEQSK